MLTISKNGMVFSSRIEKRIFPAIEHRRMEIINGIIVHQTDTSTAQQAFNAYKNKNANGAHFLIDKDGSIYQTASLNASTYHVGLLRSRCIETRLCPASELKRAQGFKTLSSLSRYETKKSWPDRFPWNTDAIGIELVGASHKKQMKSIPCTKTSPPSKTLRYPG